MNSENISFYHTIEHDLDSVRRRLDQELNGEKGLVDELCRHVAKYRGKMLRPALLLLAGQACGRLTDKHIEYATLVELLHLATLIHDDVLDQAAVRRQRATVSKLWGNEAGVLVGDFILSKVFDLSNRVEEPKFQQELSQAAKLVCRGELTQCLCRQKWDMTEEEYLHIIQMKTGVLYEFCCRIGASLAGGNQEQISALETFGRLIGESFQIIDDLLDLTGRESEVGKTLRTDLLQGKPTLPIIHFLQQADEHGRKLIIGLLNDPESEIQQIRALLDASKSLQYTERRACTLVRQAREKLQTLKAGPARDSLAELADFVVKRSC